MGSNIISMVNSKIVINAVDDMNAVKTLDKVSQFISELTISIDIVITIFIEATTFGIFFALKALNANPPKATIYL